MSIEVISRTSAVRERMTRARIVSGYSMTQAASLLGFVSSQSVYNYETGHSAVTVEMFFRVCEAYQVNPIWLLTGDNPYFNREDAEKRLEGLMLSDEERDRMAELFEMKAKP